MFQLYLTPASISYLNQFILALAITLFLLNRLRSSRAISLISITAFFASMTVFSSLLIFNASLLPYPRILTVFAENAFLGLALAALNAFAYHFPQRYPKHKWEMRIVMAFSLSYFFWEVGFMIFRYISIFTQGNVFIRPPLVALSIPIIVLFAPIACLRQTLAADTRPIPWWRKLWKPEGKGARGARNFALVFTVPLALGIVNALIFFGLPLAAIHAIVSIGILIMFWLIANNYINFIPGSVNVSSRLSILTLTLFLALLGTLGWLIAPSYIETFQPDLRDHQTLRFTPNTTGGYDVSEADFHFESALGEKVDIQTPGEDGSHRVEITFPFHGETYTEAYVTYSGIVSLGQPFRALNLQADAARVPALFPLAVALDPNPAERDSGLYVCQEPERVVVTWNRLLSSQPGASYTFQTILYADGTFEFTYNGLPQSILFAPNISPTDNPLLRGAVAGRGEPWYELPAGMEYPADLVAISRVGASPLLQNYLLAFRHYLHTFMEPVAWVVVDSSILILLIIPLLLRSSVAKPLAALTAGVRRMGAGEMNITIPVQSEDEIGFLTGAFNTMSATLDDMVHNLETRVANRTRELDDANTTLRAEMVQREAAQNQLLQQQRMLATFEERQRLARNLHDSVNQSIHSLVLFSETLVSTLQRNNGTRSIQIAKRLQESARQALKEVRLMLYEFQSPEMEREINFIQDLETRLSTVERRAGVRAQVIQEGRMEYCPKEWYGNLFWITIEALNNALKHAQARKMVITIRCFPQSIDLEVVDDGIGFDPAEVRSGGMGLRNIRERADLIGGELTIDSSPGKGTRVFFHAGI